jgi:hypothetical protein
MALTNADKQRRWRAAHAGRRQSVARIATMLMRRSHTTGRTFELKVGWYETTVDEYFLKLAALLGDALKTDKAIRQLKNALSDCLRARQAARRQQRCGRPGVEVAPTSLETNR